MCDKPKGHLRGGLCINLTYSVQKKLASTDWKSVNFEALYVFENIHFKMQIIFSILDCPRKYPYPLSHNVYWFEHQIS